MDKANNQILTVAQMRAAEQSLIDGGSSVGALMEIAGRGAADWVLRLAWPKPVTVLCGPGNNGGDGYVIAETLRARQLPVTIVAPLPPGTDAARHARAAYGGDIWSGGDLPRGGTLVDCLFGSGLTRPLDDDLFGLLASLSQTHLHRAAIDLPSGVESDGGQPLNDGLPDYDLTVALGAWKFVHWTMPAAATMGARHLVPIGIGTVPGAAQMLVRPHLRPPAANAHKYLRGLVAVVAGSMPGAALLACKAAMHGGAGYVRLATQTAPASTPAELVIDPDAIDDPRLSAILIGTGLGRDDRARARLKDCLARNLPTALDADALLLLEPALLNARSAAIVATPHEGELAQLARIFGIAVAGKRAIATQLAQRAGMVVIAKGPDTVIAAPDGRLAIGRPASSWLSTAGTGDVLAGLLVSRLGTGIDPFEAACQAVWLHTEAAGRAGTAFTSAELADYISEAYESCL